MAVAVKTSPGAQSTGPLASPAILSLVGVVYLLACLAIVFKLIPDLWWSALATFGLGSYSFVGGTLLLLLSLAAGIGLLVVGARLLGPNPPEGIRAGVFIGFVGILLVILLTRWASLWMEYWAYSARIFDETTGWIMTIVIGAVLLVGWLRLFTLPSTQQLVVSFERGGWFHASAYKANQGQKVRRGTIAGLLFIVGAGIYTLVSHNTLAKGARDLAINIPFTGRVAVEYYGDTQEFLAALPGSAKSHVQIRWPGSGDTEFKTGEVVTFQTYKAYVEQVLKSDPNLAAISLTSDEPTTYLLEINKKILGARVDKLLGENFYPEGVRNRLTQRLDQTPWEDLGETINDFYREGETVVRDNPDKVIGAEFRVPSAVVMLDRYVLRDVNDKTQESQNVKVLLRGDSDLKEGSIVSRKTFNDEVTRLEGLKARGYVVPTMAPLRPASGPLQYKAFTLLPSVQFTVPFLLLAVSLWLAWRVVNMPTFADFLIATEAELNKVSWTTQKKLVQDTIVVLVTVFLMAIYLFGMDWTWKVVLSWEPIGVLHIPKEDAQQNKPNDLKRW